MNKPHLLIHLFGVQTIHALKHKTLTDWLIHSTSWYVQGGLYSSEVGIHISRKIELTRGLDGQTNNLVNLLCRFTKLSVSLSLSVCFLLGNRFLPEAPMDPILGTTQMFNADTDPRSLRRGTYICHMYIQMCIYSYIWHIRILCIYIYI